MFCQLHNLPEQATCRNVRETFFKCSDTKEIQLTFFITQTTGVHDSTKPLVVKRDLAMRSAELGRTSRICRLSAKRLNRRRTFIDAPPIQAFCVLLVSRSQDSAFGCFSVTSFNLSTVIPKLLWRSSSVQMSVVKGTASTSSSIIATGESPLCLREKPCSLSLYVEREFHDKRFAY